MSSFQAALLRQALTASQVAQTWGVVTQDAEAWATTKRQNDELLGVWSTQRGAFVYPLFQLDARVQLDRLTRLLRILRTRAGFDPSHTDRGGWGRAAWLHQPHTQLSQAALWAIDQPCEDPVAFALALRAFDDTPRCPADVFVDHPDVVITVATDLAVAAA